MSGHFWLIEARMARLRRFFAKSRGRPRVDDRRVLGGMIPIKENGPQGKDAPSADGPPKALCNRFVRWSRMAWAPGSSPSWRRQGRRVKSSGSTAPA
jgi:hypothetical protein